MKTLSYDIEDRGLLHQSVIDANGGICTSINQRNKIVIVESHIIDYERYSRYTMSYRYTNISYNQMNERIFLFIIMNISLQTIKHMRSRLGVDTAAIIYQDTAYEYIHENIIRYLDQLLIQLRIHIERYNSNNDSRSNMFDRFIAIYEDVWEKYKFISLRNTVFPLAHALYHLHDILETIIENYIQDDIIVEREAIVKIHKKSLYCRLRYHIFRIMKIIRSYISLPFIFLQKHIKQIYRLILK